MQEDYGVSAVGDPSGPATLITSSAGLGWRLARVELCRDPAQLADFAAPASAELSLVMITAGRYTIESRHDRGWRRAEYGPGSVGVNAPGRESVFRWRSSDQLRLESLHLRFPPAALHQALDDFGVAHQDVERLDTLNLEDPYVSMSLSALRRALDEEAAGLYADMVAESLLTHLVYTNLAGAGKQARVVPDPSLLGDRELQRVVDHMRDRIGEDVRLDELAGLVNISKFHFLRTFTKATGVTPHRYLTRLRLHHAAGLLRNTRLSVQQIAMTCGYTSASRFAAAFRQQYGLTPAGYRRQGRDGRSRSS
jgi:AraC family transcriptional regulator